MTDPIRQRCLDIGAYMLSHQATVRQAAAVFGISKSSVHKDMNTRLVRYDAELAEAVSRLLAYNRAVCHLRGGEATRRRYAAQRRLQSGS